MNKKKYGFSYIYSSNCQIYHSDRIRRLVLEIARTCIHKSGHSVSPRARILVDMTADHQSRLDPVFDLVQKVGATD